MKNLQARNKEAPRAKKEEASRAKKEEAPKVKKDLEREKEMVESFKHSIIKTLKT